MKKQSNVTIGDLKYLYNPFEDTVYEVLKNMFDEPDEIYAKIRVHSDEKGLKSNKLSWENIKTMASFSYLGGNLTDEKKAISDFHTDVALKVSKMEEELTCLKNTMCQLNERKTAINFSRK